MEMLNRFRDILNDPDAVALKWKEQGKKVVGYRCLFVPEEIIWAAGMLPFPLLGTPKPVGLADSYIQSSSCEFIRNIFDHALEGRFKFLDMIALANTCDVIRRLPDVWNEYIDNTPVCLINNPQKILHDGNRDYYMEELARFKAMIEKVSGNAVIDEKLHEAIVLYNETRSLLRELNGLRETDPPLLSGEEAFTVNMAATILPVEEVNPMLRNAIDEFRGRDVEDSFAARIMVTGSLIEHPSLIQMIEEEGGLVVVDDLCTTMRYCWHSVEEKSDPMEALYRYLNNRPVCACLHPHEARLEYMMELIDRFKVDAVINFNLKYCHPFLYDTPIFQSELENREIPAYFLEVGHDLSGHGQLRTRLQAFIEMIDSE